MRVTAVLAIVLITILIIVSSIYVNGKVSQSSQKSTTGTSTDSSANKGSKDSSSNRNIETDPNQPSKSIGDKSTKDLAPANGFLPNTSSSASSNDQDNPKPAENETATGNVASPDGRIYAGGEGPYAYIPTYSHKGQQMPIAPLGPID